MLGRVDELVSKVGVLDGLVLDRLQEVEQTT